MIRIQQYYLSRAVVFVFSFSLAEAGRTATEVEVIKVKGNRAIIRFPEKALPGEGERLYLSRESPRAGDVGDRDYSLSVTSGIVKRSPGGVTTDCTGSFGFNWGYFEVAPGLTLSRVGATTGGSAVSTLSANVLATVNFTENEPGKTFVFGMDAGPLLGRASSGTVSTTTLGFDSSLFMKAFVLRRSSTALRVDFGYGYTRSKTGAFSVNYHSYGPAVGLSTYF